MNKNITSFLLTVFYLITLSQNGLCEVQNIKVSSIISVVKFEEGVFPEPISYKNLRIKKILLEMVNSEEFQEPKRIAAAVVLSKVPIDNESATLVEEFLLKYKNSDKLKELQQIPAELVFIQTGILTISHLLYDIKYAENNENIKFHALMFAKMEGAGVAKLFITREIKLMKNKEIIEKLELALSLINTKDNDTVKAPIN